MSALRLRHDDDGLTHVVGAGTDCNNYLDVRNELHVTNQATVRIDQMFAQRRQR